ncbi:MAG: hypothetical protein ACQGVC_12000, partial [Myxococcota bacterium]
TPPTNVQLRATLDATALPRDTPVPWKRETTGTLKVVMVDGLGREHDVTRHPSTRIDSMTPWTVVVEDGTRLRFAPGAGMEHMREVKEPYAIVQILHRDPKAKRSGRAVVSFELHD